jgi:hypothetical protein
VKRFFLTAGMVLAALNIWTGAPLLALWIGSRVQGGGSYPKLTSILVVVGVLMVVAFGLLKLLEVLSFMHDEASGRQATVRAHLPWLRSMRGERPLYPGEQAVVTVVERVLILMVVLAVIVFEIWFFFFSPSPIDSRSGRSFQVPPQERLLAAAPAAEAPSGVRGLTLRQW